MFSLTEQTATLAHINVRAERHGDEPAGAADLKIQYTTGNGILSEFHPPGCVMRSTRPTSSPTRATSRAWPSSPRCVCSAT